MRNKRFTATDRRAWVPECGLRPIPSGMAALVLLLCISAATPVHAQWERNAEGWTVFQSSSDTRKVYVSSSAGDDANSGLSPDQPVATLSRAKSLMRDGYPDWMLLRRGDTWTNQSLGRWTLRGRSIEEPMRISAYGTGARPLLKTGADHGLTLWEGDGGGYGNLAITDIRLKAHTYDGAEASGNPAGINWHDSGQNLLLENVRIDGYASNIIVRSPGSADFRNLQVRRSVITDAFAKHGGYENGSHAQGMYTASVDGILVEENVFDHNGWNPAVEGAEPTIYNHNLYLHESSTADVVVRDNIIARASAHGLQARPGGVVEGNLFVDNALAFFIGGEGGSAYDNLVLHASDRTHGDGLYRATGIDMKNIAGSEAFRNIIAQTPINGRRPLFGLDGVDAHTNIIFNWGNYENVGPFLDPDRTIPGYDAMIGGEGTIASFLEGARTLSRNNWRSEYTAEQVRAYFPYFLSTFEHGEITLIPEPSAFALLAVSGVALLGRPRRRKRALSR